MALEAQDGTIRAKVTQRHAAADVAKFGVSTPYIWEAYADATHYIRLYWSAANTITLAFDDSGGAHSDTWNATGAIAAATTYQLEVTYSATNMLFKVDSVTKITITTAIDFGGTPPSTVYWGSNQAGANQLDATFDAAVVGNPWYAYAQQ
jgi:hypothetical protein